MSDVMKSDNRSASQSGSNSNYQEVGPRRRLTTETKLAFKTTEFWIYAIAVAGVLLASKLVGTTQNHADYFRADKAWFYIVILTVGYMVSRGFAKAEQGRL